MIKYLLIFCLLIVVSGKAFPQAAIGEWIDYQSYAQAHHLADSGETIYCITGGGLFSYSKTTHDIRKLSGINGLSDVGALHVAWSKTNNTLLLAYSNANIDLLINNEIYNLSDIKRKQISADKTIYNVLFKGNLAYLSCGFGIVVVNLERKEIKETYFIGSGGSYIKVFDLATDGAYFYAATENGIYKALANDSNLQDYTKWVKQSNIPHSGSKFSEIEFFNGKIIANYTTDAWAEDELYQLDGSTWSRFLPEIKYVADLSSTSGFLVFSQREEVAVYDKNYQRIESIKQYVLADHVETSIQPLCAHLDDNQLIWIADNLNGLIQIGTTTEKIVPIGPINQQVFSLTANGNDLWIASGGYNNSWNNLFNPPLFQLKRDDQWTVFDRNSFPKGNDFRDIVCVAVDPLDPDHVFAGSWGGGVLEFNKGKFVVRHDNFNSTLQTQLPAQPEAPYVRIGGMAFDEEGNLWVSNSGVSRNLNVFYQSTRKWESFELSDIATKYTIGKIAVTNNNDKWLVVPRGYGLYAMNSNNDYSETQKVIAYFTNGKEEVYTDMNDVSALVEDHNGELWVGTSAGIAVFGNPRKIWEPATMYASRPGLDLNDGLFHPLLEKETVSAIAVDGANRKWIGTKNSGIFLVSENGDKELLHFNTENSPLPNNEITDIAINHLSGEVFIGTSSGLISYMGEATSPNETFTNVYVYPNPVRETYDGSIVVKGLVDQTDVKITDISGNLVYKTISFGGQAIWDGRNQNGNRCKTGVYLVFMNSPDGAQTKVTKLLFIH